MHSWMIRFAANASIIAAFILVASTFHAGTEASNTRNPEKAEDIPSDSTCDVSFMLVSTIDGKVSGLDLRQRGQLSWSIDADLRPLVSSSLANLELIRNGKKLRLIPALDGAIYQFDGEKVEPLPMSAETLLSSTYQLSDDAMIVGSKSLQNFGVDFKTGEVQFMCDSDGCSSNSRETGDAANGSDVVVVTRITQVVRSVDIKNGLEKWNFSVGEHLLSLPNTDSHSQIEDHFEKHADELPNFLNGKKERQCPPADDLGDENFLRLVVPEGKVVALNKQDSSQVAWEHKFNSPIAKAWLLRKGKLHVMNLFTEQHIPTMSTFTPDDIESDSSTQPLLYIGSHQKLLYIQPSPGMEAVLKMYSGRRIGHVFDSKVKVAWRPYLNTASVRTPIFRGNKQHVVDHKKSDEKQEKRKSSLAVWHEEYPFDTGYFLYPEFRDSRSLKKPMLIEDLQRKLDSSMTNYIWTYRKEITFFVAFTLVLSLTIDFLMTNILFPRKQLTLVLESKPSTNTTQAENETQSAPISQGSSPLLSPDSNRSVNSLGEYVSRYETDFDCVQILGKGGFGVVMEAVNKVDDQHYAVKRIKLPRSEGAKEKVLREVRALAKLEHVGIVRYFNAWVESPPAGWQEEKDLDLGLSDASRQTITQLTASPATSRYSSHVKKSGRRKSSPVDTISEGSDDESASPSKLHQILNTNTNTDSVVFAYEDSTSRPPGDRITGSGSGEFVVHSDISDSGASSEGTGFALVRRHVEASKQSFIIEDEESHSCSKSSVPFSNYSRSSVELPARNEDYSIDSVVFDDESKSLSKHRDSLEHSGVHFTLSSGVNRSDQTDQKSDLQGAKFFLYIQMQLYRKDTLKDWLHNNTLNRDRPELMGIFDQILCAVDYVHSCGLMHRDLKPSNIFFSSDGVVKVGDFGLVTPLSVEEDEESFARCDSPSSNGQTHTADVGTTLYMSPEQISRKPYNLKVDVFSLGLIFLELCMPFSTQMERIRTLQDAKNHTLPVRFERELPAECNLVRKMTSEAPSHRPDIKEIMDHSLLKDFAPTRYVHFPRTRTISNDSSDSSSLPIYE